MKNLIRKIIYAIPGVRRAWIALNRLFGADEGGNIPGTQKAWNALLKFFGVGHPPEFLGWGMVTYTFPPWHNGGGDEVSKDFLKVHKDIYNQVAAGNFNLTQYNHLKIKTEVLNEVMWRHYVVFWSTRYAAMSTKGSVKYLAECGVCDGLTISFAMQALAGRHEFKSFLYDAWDGMKDDSLLASEKRHAGDYSYLNIENTKANLSSYSDHTSFNKGYIPASFENFDNPSEVAWLHIDLNSSVVTTDALKFFFDRVPPGGIILFDDYAGRGYLDTKMAVDDFFAGKPGVLLPMPTGQAVYFKQ
jgi:O-methyltransferase